MIKLLIAAMLVAMAGTPAYASEGTIRAAGPDPVPDSYIVSLKPGRDFDAVAARYGGQIMRRFPRTINGFEVRIGERNARRMAADRDVALVQRNGRTRPHITQTAVPSWGLDRIDRNRLGLNGTYDYPVNAGSVTVFVIDTGVQRSHEEMQPRVARGWDVWDHDDDASDCYGHGTHVAGTIGGTTVGVAKFVDIVPVRVGGCQGEGNAASMIDGLEWVMGDGRRPAVANMSAGVPWVDTQLDAAAASVVSAGITLVLSAGNDNRDACAQSPARTPSAITVAATTKTDSRAGFSNYGSCVDIFAPGENIVSAQFGTTTGTVAMSGTSMAAPHVAGAVAVILQQYPASTPADVAHRLLNLDPTVNALSNIGTGSPNKLLFVRSGPMRATVSCNVPTGSYSCSGEYIGGVAPVTVSWSPSSSGGCIVSKNVTVTYSAQDSLGQTASASRTFYCRGRCDLQAAGESKGPQAFCLVARSPSTRD